MSMFALFTQEVFLVIFAIVLTQIYGIRRLMGLPVPLKSLLCYSLLQTVAMYIFSFIIPLDGIEIILCSLTGLIFQVYVFDAKLFPDALIGIIGPMFVCFFGELLLPPLFLDILGPEFNAPWVVGWGSFSKPFVITALIPNFILAAWFWLQPTKAGKLTQGKSTQQRRANPASTKRFAVILVLFYAATTIFVYNFIPIEDYIFASVLFYSSTLIIPILGITLIQSATYRENSQQQVQYHVEQIRLQKAALQVLREERHDYLNELTLISSYVQMKRYQEALDCIAYAAANLSDRYNYATLPHDAWLTVLEFKKKEAKRRKIYFEVFVLADPPTDFAEQRLLPKLIMNLVDNAFAAASKDPRPQVQLVWHQEPNGTRSLMIKNNGERILPHLERRIFHGGYTSKEDCSGNNGWGLAICKKIAEELGGKLTFKSTVEGTNFILTLPKAHKISLGA